MKVPILYISSLIIIFSSCCKILPPSFSLDVIDSNGASVLPSSSTDSTWLMHSSFNDTYQPIEIISTGSGNALLIETDRIINGEDVLIKVNDSDIDTLHVEYKLTGLSCKKKLKIKRLLYNGIEFDTQSSSVTKY